MYSLGLIFILQYFLKELNAINDSFTNKEKQALRFGFHQTYDCQVFEKAFKCIRKCLDEKFDVAYADKNCACTCYHKKDKEKYRHLAIIGKGQTVPTTKLPGWALPENVEPVHSDDENAEGGAEVDQLAVHVTVGDAGAGESGTDVQNANATAVGDATHDPEVAGEAPADGEAHEEAPAEGGEAPAEGEEAAAEAEAPAEGEEAPAEGEVAPEEK